MKKFNKWLSVALALSLCFGMMATPAFAAETIDNGDGTTTVVDITEDVWTSEDGATETKITTETSTTTDENGNVVEETTKVSGSETTTTEAGPVESTEVSADVGNVTVTTTTPGAFQAPEAGETTNEDGSKTTITLKKDENDKVIGYTEVTATYDEKGNVVSSVTKEVDKNSDGSVSTTTKVNAADALKPDTSGKEWTEGEDGSHTKTEKIEGGKVTTTVSASKDDSGKNVVYTTKTVTETEKTESVTFEVPEEGEKTNEDGSKTTVTVQKDENGAVIGYVEVTEVLDAAGTVTSSVTKTVNQSGKATIKTTITETKTQTVASDASAEVKVTVGGVTAGETQGNLNTKGLDVPMDGFKPNDKIDLDQLGDDDLVFVSGLGVQSKHKLAIMWSQNINNINTKGSLYASQYVVTDKSGNSHVVYCADLSTPTDADMKYYLNNTEDADYYTNSWNHGNGENNKKDPDGGAHIREIATNGYWGTESGTGSLSKLIEDLLAAKVAAEAAEAAGEPINSALANLTEEEIRALTPDLALSATQAAIWRYGNSMNLTAQQFGTIQQSVKDSTGLTYDDETHTFIKVTESIDPETNEKVTTTQKWTMTAPQGMDLSELLKVDRDENGNITNVTYPNFIKAYLKLVPDRWLNGNAPTHVLVSGAKKDSYENQAAMAVYNYLCGLDISEDETTDLIQPSDIVEAVTNVKNAVGQDEQKRDVYEADVSFVLTVEPDRLNGDLLVNVYDSETGEIIATRRIAGKGDEQMAGSTVTDRGVAYTIDGLQLANGQNIRINLVGSQAVKKGAYLITAKSGADTSQTFVGVEEGTRDVDLNFTLQLDEKGAEVKTSESSSTVIQRDWDSGENIDYTYYELDIPENPDNPDDPTPPDDPDDPDDPTPPVEVDDPDVPLVDIPEVEVDDPDVPLVDDPEIEVDEPDVPLADEPEPEIEIDDPDIPLADVPQTGDNSQIWTILTVISGAGLVWLALQDKKRKGMAK